MNIQPEISGRQVRREAPLSARPIAARLAFVDNLRWVMIVLVVSMHAAVTYSHLGGWYFKEDPKPGAAMTALFATYQVFLQAFFMGLLFLIAGYFVPDAFDRKGFSRFLRDRAVRLGIPTLLFMLTIQPFTVYWLLKVFADPDRPPLFRAYWSYLSSGRFLGGSGPMWFTLALLGFSLVYGLVRTASRKQPANRPDGALPRPGQVVALVSVMGLCTFLVRIVQPVGTNVMNMQLCYFSQYILLFAVGIQAWRRNWLLRIPYGLGMRWFALALIGGGLAWFALLFAILRTHTESQVNGGLTWPSAALSFWESFVCVGFCLGLTVLFREKFNRRGRLTGWLSDNSFAVYFIHTPLLIAVTLALRGFAAPRPVKFLCATLLGATVSYLAAAYGLRRIPVLKRVL
ncbi:MAG: acyltransferase family protein [Limisphaerales bacterium]